MTLAIVLMFVMTLVVGAILAITPRLMPSTECFAVTVPQGTRDQEPLAGYLHTYTRVVAMVGTVCALVWPFSYALGVLNFNATTNTDVFAWLILATTFVPIITALVLMLYSRRRVMEHKAAQGWHPTATRSVTFVGPEGFPQPLPLWVNLIYLPIIATMAAFAIMHYAEFPSRIPIHYNFAGAVTTSAKKSLGTVLFPVYLTVFFGLVFTLCHWGILRSKKPIDPNAPASSALAYGRFARAQSIVMFVGGVLLSIVMGTTFFANAMEVLSEWATVAIILTVTGIFTIAMLLTSVRLGQVGARVAAKPNDGTMPNDDDKFWPLGIVYCNANDPSIVVPKRFGVGWTLNMARPGAWMAIVAIALLIVAFSWGMSILTT